MWLDVLVVLCFSPFLYHFFFFFHPSRLQAPAFKSHEYPHEQRFGYENASSGVEVTPPKSKVAAYPAMSSTNLAEVLTGKRANRNKHTHMQCISYFFWSFC